MVFVEICMKNKIIIAILFIGLIFGVSYAQTGKVTCETIGDVETCYKVVSQTNISKLVEEKNLIKKVKDNFNTVQAKNDFIADYTQNCADLAQTEYESMLLGFQLQEDELDKKIKDIKDKDKKVK